MPPTVGVVLVSLFGGALEDCAGIERGFGIENLTADKAGKARLVDFRKALSPNRVGAALVYRPRAPGKAARDLGGGVLNVNQGSRLSITGSLALP